MPATGSVRNLGWLAAACFLASWFLPVVPGMPGWMAFRQVIAAVWPYSSASGNGSVEDAVPQVLSALTNVVFLVMFVLLDTGRAQRPGLFFRVAIACFLLNLYWFVQALREHSVRELQIGYYLWMAAFAMLVIIGWMLMRSARPPTAMPPRA